MTITCGYARSLLWPDATLREATPEVVAAQAHVTGCAMCHQFFEEMRALAGLVRETVPRPSAPRQVRDRLFRTVAQARAGSRSAIRWDRPRLILAGTVGAILLCTAVWFGLARGPGGDNPEVAFVLDHVRAATTQGVLSSQPAEVASWLEKRVPYAVRIPTFPNARLLGARLCLMDGRYGAVLQFLIDDHSVSYYVVPAEHSGPRNAPMSFHHASKSGYRVVAWQKGDLVHALVGDLPEASLTALAHLCIRQSMAALFGRRGLLA